MEVDVTQAQPLVWVDSEQALDEIYGQGRDRVPYGKVKRDHALCDLLVDGDVALLVKRRGAREHDVEDDAHGPDVDACGVPRV